MRLPKRDLIATALVMVAGILYLLWVIDAAPPGMGGTRLADRHAPPHAPRPVRDHHCSTVVAPGTSLATDGRRLVADNSRGC